MNGCENTKRAFTLIELLTVLAIIGVIASVVVVSLSSSREKSREANRIQAIGQISNAIQISRDQSTESYDTYSNTPAAQIGLQEYYPGDWDGITYVDNSNAMDNKNYCVYTQLLDGTYFVASGKGTGYRDSVPLITDCAPTG